MIAAHLGGFLTNPCSATGGVLIIGLGIVLLEIKRLRVANYLPALLIAPLVVAILAVIGVSF